MQQEVPFLHTERTATQSLPGQYSIADEALTRKSVRQASVGAMSQSNEIIPIHQQDKIECYPEQWCNADSLDHKKRSFQECQALGRYIMPCILTRGGQQQSAIMCLLACRKQSHLIEDSPLYSI
uniref:AlNc14C249G9600 protein n=1 Tax=Albugo laibachii Nc14 TaxID=890382 RepID=F0WTC0_9STRA|nr:AlNc14C249G9600 [Albugo laibachii Nc14]|eukprot:CCA24610.1 AlNc14C249G9600 [Albugo laibachii Nc14]